MNIGSQLQILPRNMTSPSAWLWEGPLDGVTPHHDRSDRLAREELYWSVFFIGTLSSENLLLMRPALIPNKAAPAISLTWR